MNAIALKRLSLFVILSSLTLLIGCAGMEFAPKNVKDACCWYFPTELVQADKAVADAKKAGKDKVCPVEFAEAKLLKKKAYETYVDCNTDEAKKMAKEATKMAKALCPAKPKPISMMPSDKVIDKFTLTINFDFDKSAIRSKDKKQLDEAIAFVKKYKGHKVKLEGHTDWTGTEQYNQRLSERRAAATSKYLVDKGGIDPKMISSVGYGELKPVASNKTRDGRAKNRRVEILILAD
ncbi:MAG: OmpA family protein [Nitrospira sp.]|nr:OmpA family protein [Nitrospira sp.]